MSDLWSFIRESNRIEGIHREPTPQELNAHRLLVYGGAPAIGDVERFVFAVANAPIRGRKGMDVRVGGYRPPAGGREIGDALSDLLLRLEDAAYMESGDTPYDIHCQYERLHPFMDGNGRSGRALWAWHRVQIAFDPFALGFLHSFYYESLAAR